MSNFQNAILPSFPSSSIVQAIQINNAPKPQQLANPYIGRVPNGDAPDSLIYLSSLNTPVYSNVFFPEGQYTDNFNVLKNWPQQQYEAVLMRVSQAKKIVYTEIAGRDGTVKEYIGMDDYVIDMQGIITGSNGRYPIEAVRNLKQMLNAPIPLRVVSTWLQNLDIDNVVVQDFEFPQAEGGQSYQIFSIVFRSDMPQELLISQNV